MRFFPPIVLLSLVIGSLLVGCRPSGNPLTDEFVVQVNLPPSGNLDTRLGQLDAFWQDETTIYGYFQHSVDREERSFAFLSNDFFQTVGFAPFAGVGIPTMNNGPGDFFSWDPTQDQFTLTRSRDGGQTFESWRTFPTEDPSRPDADIRWARPQMQGVGNGIIFKYIDYNSSRFGQPDPFPDSVLFCLFSQNGLTELGGFPMDEDKEIPAYAFSTQDRGWVSIRTGLVDLAILHTEDGGNSWKVQDTIPDISSGLFGLQMRVHENTMLLFLQGFGSTLYISHGPTNTQTLLTLEQFRSFLGNLNVIMDIELFSETNMLMALRGDEGFSTLWTSNNGVDWQLPDADTVRTYTERFRFFNDQVGLSVGERTLELTRDGGKTWELLVYPLP